MTVFDLDTNAKLFENNRLYQQTTFGEFKVRPIPWIGHGTKPSEGCPPTWESPLSYPLLLNYCAHTYTPDHRKEDTAVEVISSNIENVLQPLSGALTLHVEITRPQSQTFGGGSRGSPNSPISFAKERECYCDQGTCIKCALYKKCQPLVSPLYLLTMKQHEIMLCVSHSIQHNNYQSV